MTDRWGVPVSYHGLTCERPGFSRCWCLPGGGFHVQDSEAPNAGKSMHRPRSMKTGGGGVGRPVIQG